MKFEPGKKVELKKTAAKIGVKKFEFSKMKGKKKK